MLGYTPPLWWCFDDETGKGDEMGTPYEEYQIGELRARIAALVAERDSLCDALATAHANLKAALVENAALRAEKAARVGMSTPVAVNRDIPQEDY